LSGELSGRYVGRKCRTLHYIFPVSLSLCCVSFEVEPSRREPVAMCCFSRRRRVCVQFNRGCSLARLPDNYSSFNGHIKTAEQRTITQQNGDLIGTLAVDGWAVTFGTARRGLGGVRSRPVPS